MTQPSFDHHNTRQMIDACIHMWGQMFPKKIQLDLSGRVVGVDIIDMSFSQNDHILDLVKYSYVGMEWCGCPNSLFIATKSPN